jgi:hypothetical protein
MELEVREVMLVEEQERGLHPCDGQDMSVELDKGHTHVERIDGEHAAEAEQLSW